MLNVQPVAPVMPRRPLPDHFSPGGQFRLDMDSDEEITHVAMQTALEHGLTDHLPVILRDHLRWVGHFRKVYRRAYLAGSVAMEPGGWPE